MYVYLERVDAETDNEEQNPGRVVTLVHKEDWDKFSEAVRIASTSKSYRIDNSGRMRFRMRTSYGVGHRNLNLRSFLILTSHAHAGIAHTIDPAYEAEVREYLGQAMFLYSSYPQERF